VEHNYLYEMIRSHQIQVHEHCNMCKHDQTQCANIFYMTYSWDNVVDFESESLAALFF
jgi:hypothetical protein